MYMAFSRRAFKAQSIHGRTVGFAEPREAANDGLHFLSHHWCDIIALGIILSQMPNWIYQYSTCRDCDLVA